MAHRIMNKDLKAAKHPTFEVFKRNGRLKPHLRRAFLEKVEVTQYDMVTQEVELADGSIWPIKVDGQDLQAFRDSINSLSCIASCQEDWQGNKIAVVRLYKDKNHGTNIS